MTKPNQIQINNTRLTYMHLEEPHAAVEGAKPKYSVCLLIPKNHEQVDAIKKAMNEAIASKWGGKPPKGLRSPLRDGDQVDDSGERLKGDDFAGCYYMTASNPKKVAVKAWKDGRQATSDDMVWGYYGSVLVSFFSYDAAGNRGVGAGLDGVWITRQGNPMGGAAKSWSMDGIQAEDFSAMPEPEMQPARQSGDIF